MLSLITLVSAIAALQNQKRRKKERAAETTTACFHCTAVSSPRSNGCRSTTGHLQCRSELNNQRSNRWPWAWWHSNGLQSGRKSQKVFCVSGQGSSSQVKPAKTSRVILWSDTSHYPGLAQAESHKQIWMMIAISVELTSAYCHSILMEMTSARTLLKRILTIFVSLPPHPLLRLVLVRKSSMMKTLSPYGQCASSPRRPTHRRNIHSRSLVYSGPYLSMWCKEHMDMPSQKPFFHSTALTTISPASGILFNSSLWTQSWIVSGYVTVAVESVAVGISLGFPPCQKYIVIGRYDFQSSVLCGPAEIVANVGLDKNIEGDPIEKNGSESKGREVFSVDHKRKINMWWERWTWRNEYIRLEKWRTCWWWQNNMPKPQQGQCRVGETNEQILQAHKLTRNTYYLYLPDINRCI